MNSGKDLLLRLCVFLRVLICLAAVLIGQGGPSLRQVAASEPCEQGCPDDDEKGQCPPSCDDCHCCSHLRTIALVPSEMLLPEGRSVVRAETTEKLTPALFVDDILHVPKRSA